MLRIRNEDPEASALLQRALSRGEVAVLPTDTLYGFSTALSSRRGHERIAVLKGAAAERRFLYLAGGVEMVGRYIDGWGCVSREVLDRVWPAPLTAVFRAGTGCPVWVGRTIAVRVPANEWLRTAVDAFGEPILSTSVNEAGEPPLDDPDTIDRMFGSAIDLLIDGGRLASAEPSTLVDFTGTRPVVLRRGVYVWEGDGKPSN